MIVKDFLMIVEFV